MKRLRFLAVPLLAVLAFAWSVRPVMAQAKQARGTVTAVSDASLTVKVGDKDVTFAVDQNTRVGAPGAGRRTRDVKATGGSGIKLSDVVKTGGAVLVFYNETGGTNRATEVRTIASAGSGGGSVTEGPKTANGKVKSVAAGSLVITDDGKDSTFAVDANTKVLGQGAGTATKQAGGKVSITDLVSAGDTVSVSYLEAGGAMRATRVRITVKAR